MIAALTRWCELASNARWFRTATVLLIVVNAVLIGIETDKEIANAHETGFAWAHRSILGLFLAELAVRIASHGRAWPQFFRSGWNVFDTALVVASMVPAVGAWATVARLARVLRVGRVLSVSPQLRLIVSTMFRSIPSLGHVGLLLGLLLYIYAVIGVELFGASDPAHWGTLGRALLTLFQVLTLEGWVELQRTSMSVHPWAWMFYGSFVLVAVFVVVNLFIAVVLNNLDLARRELDGPSAAEPTMADLAARIDAVAREVRRLHGGRDRTVTS
jgi:voltage-gated sodium channel